MLLICSPHLTLEGQPPALRIARRLEITSMVMAFAHAAADVIEGVGFLMVRSASRLRAVSLLVGAPAPTMAILSVLGLFVVKSAQAAEALPPGWLEAKLNERGQHCDKQAVEPRDKKRLL